MDVCRSKIHHEQFHTNESGTLSWEEVECLGACVNAPMVMIFKDTYEDLTPERLAEIIDEFEAGRGDSVQTGPQIDRWFSAPETGFTSLTGEKPLKKSAKGKATSSAKGAAASVPPSNAGKPKTASAETSPAVKSPSKVKASPAAENSASVKAPAASAKAANKVEPAVEEVNKQRKRPKSQPGPAASFSSPELLKGAPIGAAGKKIVEKSSAKGKSPSRGVKRPGKKPV
jgi:NADH-quinone oxidoreductase subunit E